MSDFVYKLLNSNPITRACTIAAIICFNWIQDNVHFIKKAGISTIEFFFILFVLTGMPIFFLMFR